MAYYWIRAQSEYATDLGAQEPPALQELFPRLLQHCSLSFSDALSFLGRKATGDPRPSHEERYPTKEAYVAAVRGAAETLVGQRLAYTEHR